jgi:integrase
MRPEGGQDVPLGTDREKALARWDELFHKRRRIKGTLEEAFKRWEEEKLPEYDNAETRSGYEKSLRMLRHKDHDFSVATWDGVTMGDLVDYLKVRSGKTRANREMALLSVIWRQAIIWGMTTLPWPAAGLEKSKWKNKEKPRRFIVTDALFDAVYEQAEPMLRDCMDLSTATGMRLTDCRTIVLPADNILHLEASKTGKAADFDLSLSQVLPDLLKRRKELKAPHLMLLSMPDGSVVTPAKLRGAYDRARAKAAEKARQEKREEFAQDIERMILRDMRKRAANLAEDADEAQKLLQHSSKTVTLTHYRTRAEKVKPVR